MSSEPKLQLTFLLGIKPLYYREICEDYLRVQPAGPSFCRPSLSFELQTTNNNHTNQ